ncbi:MAG TPA: bacterioferritin [Bacteroidia bacterium]
MKGNKKITERLNKLLSDELTAVNQYIVQAEICEKWGHKKFHDDIKKQAIDEMRHAEKLIARILFLEGMPVVTKLNKINIGKNIEEQFRNDCLAESGAIKSYTESIQLAEDSGDRETAELLRSILQDEEKHLQWLETQSEQLKQVELQNYLLEQIS